MGASYFLTVGHKDLDCDVPVEYVCGIKQQQNAMEDTIQAIQQAAEHAPEPGKIADGLRGWWTPAGWYVCASCSSRIIGRGCQLPKKSEPVWMDRVGPFGVCCVCETSKMKPPY